MRRPRPPAPGGVRERDIFKPPSPDEEVAAGTPVIWYCFTTLQRKDCDNHADWNKSITFYFSDSSWKELYRTIIIVRYRFGWETVCKSQFVLAIYGKWAYEQTKKPPFPFLSQHHWVLVEHWWCLVCWSDISVNDVIKSLSSIVRGITYY